MHGSYYRRARAFSRADLEEIRQKFDPTAVVVLIDDVYDAAGSIRSRDIQDTLRLREIATWRSIEGMIADFIAIPHGVPSYVLAVKHPVSMACKLLFEDSLKVYSAFPISRTRGDAASRQEIEDFKSYLRSAGIVVFDPSTIDELLLRHQLQGSESNPVSVDLGQRWPTAPERLLCDGRPDPWAGRVCEFSKAEIEEATEDIETQVESRDFRLIHDAKAIVAYRPNWGGTESRGVTSELHLARNIGRRVFVLSPPEDEGGATSPFRESGNVYGNKEELVEALKRLDA